MTQNVRELLVAVALLALAVFISNPFRGFMPSWVLLISLVIAFVLFCLYAAYVLQERPTDEREAAHQEAAGRWGFFAGSAVLVIALLFEGFAHAVDPWIPVALAAMILVKLGARAYADRYR